MRVAAVVVAYNSAQDLPLSLGALRDLPLEQIIVVDNSSTDNSVTVAQRYTKHVMSLPNVGFGAAINTAVAGIPDVDAYLLFNPDCDMTIRDFTALVAALRNGPRLGAVAPRMRYPDGRYGISGGPDPSMVKEWLAALRIDHLVPRGLRRHLLRMPLLRKRIKMLEYLDVGPSDETSLVSWVSGFCMLVRSEAFHDVGGFDSSYFLYFEDVDICRRLGECGWDVASVGSSTARHKESTSTRAVGKNRLYRSGMTVYFSKYGTRTQRLLAAALKRSPI